MNSMLTLSPQLQDPRESSSDKSAQFPGADVNNVNNDRILYIVFTLRRRLIAVIYKLLEKLTLTSL